MKAERSFEYLYRIAFLCGLLPLTVGTGIYLLWLVTEWDVLMVAGIFTIWGGLASVAIGFGAVAIYAFKLRVNGALWRDIAGRIAKPIGLMLFNLPACIVIFSLAWSAVTRYDVTLTNESESAIAHFQMVAPGVEESFEDVKPGESRSVGVHFSGDGPFYYMAEVNREVVRDTIEYYVTHNLRGEAEVLYTDTGFQVERTWD